MTIISKYNILEHIKTYDALLTHQESRCLDPLTRAQSRPAEPPGEGGNGNSFVLHKYLPYIHG